MTSYISTEEGHVNGEITHLHQCRRMTVVVEASSNFILPRGIGQTTNFTEDSVANGDPDILKLVREKYSCFRSQSVSKLCSADASEQLKMSCLVAAQHALLSPQLTTPASLREAFDLWTSDAISLAHAVTPQAQDLEYIVVENASMGRNEEAGKAPSTDGEGEMLSLHFTTRCAGRRFRIHLHFNEKTEMVTAKCCCGPLAGETAAALSTSLPLLSFIDMVTYVLWPLLQ